MLADAGADIVVGSHAHVVQPRGSAGKTLVGYGLGNFQFYASGGPGSNSGVLTVTVNRGGVTGSEWHPATIVERSADAADGAGGRRACCGGEGPLRLLLTQRTRPPAAPTAARHVPHVRQAGRLCTRDCEAT